MLELYLNGSPLIGGGEAGGTAVDAAVATAFALHVLEPMMSGPGGGSMTLWDPTTQTADFADQYPYAASATTLTAALVPRWAQSGGRDSLLHRLDQGDLWARIRSDMAENLERRGGVGRIQFRSFSPNPSIEGKTLVTVAASRDEEPLTAALHLIERVTPGIVSYNMLDEDVERFMQQPWTMSSSDGGLVARGDGVPHPRNYGAFPRKLGRCARDRGVFEPGSAVRSMTQLSATVMGLPDRGRLQPGAAADLVVFDLKNVNEPATLRAPHQLSEGMVHVLVNGRMAIHDGTFTGARPGQVLSLQSE